MGKFCNGPVFNESLSWNTHNPNLTPCLRDAILPSVPCGLLWITLPIWIHWVRNYKPKLKIKTDKGPPGWKQRMTLLFVTKTLINVIVIVNAAGELVWRIGQDPEGFKGLQGSDVFYPCCIFISAFLALIMQCTEKIYLIRSSPSLTMFWLLLPVVCIGNFKIEVEFLIDNSGSVSLLGSVFNDFIIILSSSRCG